MILPVTDAATLSSVDRPNDVSSATEFSSPEQVEAFRLTRRPARCPQCDQADFAPVGRFEPSSAMQSEFRVVECSRCSMMFTDLSPGEAETASLYSGDYHDRQTRVRRDGSSLSETWRAAKLERVYRHMELSVTRSNIRTGRVPRDVPEFADHYLLPPFGKRRLLDLGCGVGAYLDSARRIGWDVAGIDRSAAAIEKGRFELGLDLHAASVETAPYTAGSFDLITAWQVVEHFDRPRRSLSFVRRLLRPDGLFMLTVPNQGGSAAELFGSCWYGLDVPRHLSHFTIATVVRMLQSEGFEIVRAKTIRKPSWIRKSAMLARAMRKIESSTGRGARSANRSIASSRSRVVETLFGGRVLSGAASTWATYRNLGESIHVVARPV